MIIPALTQWNICVVRWSIRRSNSFGSVGGMLGIAVGRGLRPNMPSIMRPGS